MLSINERCGNSIESSIEICAKRIEHINKEIVYDNTRLSQTFESCWALHFL